MTTSTAAHSAPIPIFAQRYASAYINSVAKKDYNSAREEIEMLLSFIRDSEELKEVIENPLFTKPSKINVFEDIAKKTKMSGALLTFIKTVMGNNRFSNLPSILRGVLIQLDDIQGIIEATVETAYPLNKTQSATLEKEIGQMTGGKARISIDVKPELIGGLVITIGSKRIDGSIKRRLELLEQDLRDSANENLKQAKTA